MSKVCKLLILIFCIIPIIAPLALPSTALGKKNGNIAHKDENSMLQAKEVFYDSTQNIAIAKGDVHVFIENMTVNADKITYDMNDNIVFAEGNIQIIDQNDRTIFGSKAFFKNKMKHGLIKEFAAKLDKDSVIVAQTAKRVDDEHFLLENAVFTPCDTTCSHSPIWQIKAQETNIDYKNQSISYNHLFFELYGVPIIYLPYLSHPTPKAKPRSGILTPKMIKDDLSIPFYYHIKPNIDFTISPRLSTKYTIFDFEYRHKVKNGDYKFIGSVGNPEHKKTKNNLVDNSNRNNRYYLNLQGNFYNNDINYGFDISRTSDKAYITNYHDIYDSYLPSKFYVNTTNKRDYFSLEGMYFQDLRSENVNLHSLILPSVDIHKVLDLSDDETTLLNIKNSSIVYNDSKHNQLARNALDLQLMHNIISDGGHLLTLTAGNRADLYVVDNPINQNKKALYRNIPEISARWRYPLANKISNKSTIKIEPSVMLALGRKYKKSLEKFNVIDSLKNELSENNIFSTNRFSGTDYHDYGSRLSYGLNAALFSGPLYIDSFLGQLVYKNNVIRRGNSEYVGNIRAELFGDISLYYRFRRDYELKPIQHEVGFGYNNEYLRSNLSFAELHQAKKYFADNDINVENDRFSQFSASADYKIHENIWIGVDTRLDIASKRARVLVRSIRVTYAFDCVSISASITDNFLLDNARGIPKTRSKSFSVGLKVLNM